MKPIPRVHIAHLPTAVESLSRLSAKLGGPNIYVKRDDQTGLAFGGNKTRKLEYLVADAQSHGARTLITGGAAQSNHCRQTAAAAARFGFDCILVLTGEESEKRSANLLLDTLFGVSIVWSEGRERDELLQEVFQSAWQDGKRPYLIPYGGSNILGAYAYAQALLELREQIKNSAGDLRHDPDWIVIASSSGGTQAGLSIGAKLCDFQGRILGISIDEEADSLHNRIVDLAYQSISKLDLSIEFSPSDVDVNADYLGEGYGVAGDLEISAIRLFAKTEGLLLDPVYTGRTAGAMIDLIERGFFDSEHSVLFWHTGGTPALFADRYNQMYDK